MMDDPLRIALADRFLAMGDDELILAHRNSEWTGHAPILEEDIAFANIAQDELGHANIWYGLRQALTGDDPDQLVFFRAAEAFRNVQLVELPKGDWALTMVRQYLFDAAEQLFLARWAQSGYQPLADAAAKIRPEELYHLRHTSTWVRRLGLGTAESQRRMQAAVTALWPYALQLFVPLPADDRLQAAGIIPDPAAVRADWLALVRPWLAESGLAAPATIEPVTTRRRDHSEHLASLVADLQYVARLDPQAEW